MLCQTTERCSTVHRCRRTVGKWMKGLCLDFTNPVGTGGVLNVCLCCLGCGGVGGVGGEWVGAWNRV